MVESTRAIATGDDDRPALLRRVIKVGYAGVERLGPRASTEVHDVPDETINLSDPDDDDDAPTGASEQPRVARPSARWMLPAFAAGGALLVGSAAFGLFMCSARRDAVADNRDLRDQVTSLSDALELHRSGAAEVSERLETCTEDLTGERAVVHTVNTRITVLQTQLEAATSQLSDVKQSEAEAASRLQEFEAFANRFRTMIDSGDLDVVYRRGQMVLKLPAAILFPSASAELSDKGKAALAQVAAILVTFPERRFTVAGHTDNERIVQSDFKDNWELSAARAVIVLKMLIELGVPPKNLIAAGYGPYAPVAKNTTPYGRRANRRIEIILEPELSELPEPPELTKPE